MDQMAGHAVHIQPVQRLPRVSSSIAAIFTDTWQKGITNPPPELVAAWQQRFGLSQEQIRGWFRRKRGKERKPSLNIPGPSVVHAPAAEFPKLEGEALRDEEQAGCQAFPNLPQEIVIRLVTIFNKINPTASQLEGISDIMSMKLSDVEAFSTWRAARRLRLATETSQRQGPGMFIYSSWNTAVPMEHTSAVPSSSGSDHQSPFTPQESSSFMEVDPEVEEAVASLPTPQPSVGRSPSPPKAQTQPQIAHASLWEIWNREREINTPPLHQTENIPTHHLLQAMLPSIIIEF